MSAVADTDCSPVITAAHGRIWLITFNRPAVRNAINKPAACALATALDELDQRQDLAVGVLTGAGGTFCAGMDLKAFLAGDHPIVPGRGFAGIVEQGSRKPLIAAIEGYALAGGFEIALACDLIVASRTAMFGLPEVKRGLIAAGGGLLRLPSRIPYHHAMEMVLTGDLLPASRAAELGLVNHLVDEGEAVARALELAERIAANAPLAIEVTKRMVTESFACSREAFDRQRQLYERLRRSVDADEGARAFTEKRQPNWRGC